MNKTLLTIGSCVVVSLLVAFAVYSYVNGIRDEGIEREKMLSGQYLANQNYLSSYVSGFYEQAGALAMQSDTLNAILEDAVKGRYDEGGFAVDSPMFAAVVEAYPEAGVAQLMENWGRFQDYISAGRDGYRDKQDKLIDMLQRYDQWREKGLVKSAIIRALGYPSRNLEARIGDSIATGEVARNQMYHIVLTSKATEAYTTGEMEPLSLEQ